LIYSSWADQNKSDGIGHSAHLWGAIYGIVFILVADILFLPDINLMGFFFNQLMEGPTMPF